MSASSGYCELCDMTLAYCPHGQPKPEPAPDPIPKPRARTTRAAPRKGSKPAGPALEVRSKPRRWTPAEEFETAILVVLAEAGGELSKEAALAALDGLVGDRLTEGDRQKAPTGEVRWQLAARKARQSLVADGRMVNATPGLWTLA